MKTKLEDLKKQLEERWAKRMQPLYYWRLKSEELGTLMCNVNMWLKKRDVVYAFLWRHHSRSPHWSDADWESFSRIQKWLAGWQLETIGQQKNLAHLTVFCITRIAVNSLLHYMYCCEQLWIIRELVPSVCHCIQERTTVKIPDISAAETLASQCSMQIEMHKQ